MEHNTYIHARGKRRKKVYTQITYMTGSNIFRIFKHGVGLIKGGFTAVVKFSNAKMEYKKLKNRVVM